jgi:hypothetical protein
MESDPESNDEQGKTREHEQREVRMFHPSMQW